MSIESIDQLTAVLVESQRLGFLGRRPITEVIAHARGFVTALARVGRGKSDPPPHVVDLGAGGGVPGLVIAHDRPDLELTLLDRRTKRTDFLERAVRKLGWTDRVTVSSTDAAAFAASRPSTFDAVVARGFGPPERTIGYAGRLVRPGGIIVISEPPTRNRWDAAMLRDLGVEWVDAEAGMAVFARFT